MTLMATLAGIAMAVGAPLVYADQARSIIKKRNAEGFSKDVCAVLLIANICRCFFWLGERFEIVLLLQSILMIIAQIFLLSLLIRFRPGSFASSTFSVSSSDQPAAAVPVTPTKSSATAPTSRPVPQPQFSFDVQPPTPSDTEPPPNPWKNAQTEEPRRGAGGYAPLLNNLNLPPPPILGYEEGEEEEENAASQARGGGLRRFGARLALFLRAGFRTKDKKRMDGSSGSRPFGFWTWQTMSSYLIFLALLMVFLGVLQLLLWWSRTYVSLLGYVALGLESTLPIPQAWKNYQRRSLSGFRLSVLAGWLAGDLFKTVYFVVQASPIQFTVCALFQLSIDFLICAQVYLFREKTAQDDEEQRLSEAEALEAGQGRRAVEEEATLEHASAPAPSSSLSSSNSSAQPLPATSHFSIEADDEDEEDAKR